MVSQLTQNFPSISKSMLHSTEGKFYVGSLEVHNPNPNSSSYPTPNYVPYRGGGKGEYKVSPP